MTYYKWSYGILDLTKLFPLLAIFTLLLNTPSWASDPEPDQKRQKSVKEEDVSSWDILDDLCKLRVLSHLPPDARAVSRHVSTDFRRLVNYMETNPNWLGQIQGAKTFAPNLSVFLSMPSDLIEITRLELTFRTSWGTTCTHYLYDLGFNRKVKFFPGIYTRSLALQFGDCISARIFYKGVRSDEGQENPLAQYVNAVEIPTLFPLEPQEQRSKLRLVHKLLHPGKNPTAVQIKVSVNPDEASPKKLKCGLAYKYPTPAPQAPAPDPILPLPTELNEIL